MLRGASLPPQQQRTNTKHKTQNKKHKTKNKKTKKQKTKNKKTKNKKQKNKTNSYGKIFRLSFGPKTFVVISDPRYAKQILLTNAEKYSKGLLSEILDFVMGQGLIPAVGEVWKSRRRAIVPALHKRYVASMVGMFGDCAAHGAARLDEAAEVRRVVVVVLFCVCWFVGLLVCVGCADM